MSITVRERGISRTSSAGRGPATELLYWIQGTSDDLEALAALADEAPLFHGQLPRYQVRVEESGPDLYDGTVIYQIDPSTDPPNTGESVFSFETGGGSAHITQSLQTIASYAPPGKSAPNFKGAIGVTADSVEGVEIVVPVYQFAETHYVPDNQVTNQYKAILFNLTGRVNDAAFMGFAAGEVLFLGVSGSKRGQGDWELAFRFAAKPNRENLSVGDITGIDKKGWEYLWVRYAEEEDSAAGAIVKRPIAVYVEQVYEPGDFSLLGL
jgi:hypothetical protein